MNTAPCTATIPLVRPWHQRMLDTSLADVVGAARQVWQRYEQQRRLQRELKAVADMNELLLRDIGAPEWMVAEARARRDATAVRSAEEATAWQRGWQ